MSPIFLTFFLAGGQAVPGAQPSIDPPFIISMWCGPSREHITVGDYKTVADCGFNVVFPPCEGGWGCNPDTNLRILDVCQQVGLQAVIADSRLIDREGRIKIDPSSATFEATVDSVIADYARHPALAGYYHEDEPGRWRFPTLGAVVKRFREKDPGRFPYVNIYPSNCPTDGLGTPTYEEHVTAFIETVKPVVVSYDNYQAMNPAYMGRNGDPQFFFCDLETIRKASLKAGLPFIQIILVTPHWYYTVDPDTADIRWQVYTTLAYGAHGIMYFTYWPVLGTPEANPSIVDGEGKPTRKYQIVRDINLRVRALAPTLVTLKSIGVYHTDPLPHGQTMWLASDAPVKHMEGGPMLLGWLQDGTGNDFIFLVNRARRDKLKARLTFKDHVRDVEEVSQQTGKLQQSPYVPASQLLVTDLEAGEGRLYRLMR